MNINMMYNGKIKSGMGNASFWVNKISSIFKEKYGIELFAGTLNVELEKEFVLRNTETILPNEYGGKYKVLIQKCSILGEDAYIVRPENNNVLGGDHPLNIIEIVSEKKLRDKYDLKDNDKVIIEI